MPQNPESLRRSIKNLEKRQERVAIPPGQLQGVAQEVYDLHKLVYGYGRNGQIRVLPPVETSRQFIGDSIDMKIPRAKYFRQIGLLGFETPSGEKKITGAQIVG